MRWGLGPLVALVCALVAVGARAAASSIVFDQTPPAQSNQTSATFQFHSSGGGTPAFQCSLDSGAATSCISPDTVSGLSEGSHTFKVTILGAAANEAKSYTWNVDLTPPTTVVTAQPPALTNSTTATFEFSSPDPTATFRCSLNGAAPGPCTSPVAYSGLADATRTLLIQAVDPAGNVDTTAQPIKWTVDTTPPDTLLTKPKNVVAKPFVVFSFTSSESGSTFECSLDNASSTPCTSPAVIDIPGSGPHKFSVKAVDAAGNADPTPAVYAWTSDLTPPRRPKVAIFEAPTASASSAAPLPVFKSPGLGVTFTNPLTKLLGTPTFTLATRLDAQWRSDSTATAYDVTVSTLPEDSTGIDEHEDNVLTIKQYPRTKRTALRLKTYPGETVCVKVDARDKVGNVSSPRTACTTTPDSFAPPWGPYTFHRVKDKRAWRNYYILLSHRYALTQAIGDRAYFSPSQAVLVAERCRGCGSVEFAFSKYPLGPSKLHELAVVSLHGASKRGRLAVINVNLPRRRLESDGEGLLVIVRLTGKPRLSGVGFVH